MAATCSTEGAVEVAVWLGAAVPRAISKPTKKRVTIRLVMGSSSLNRDFLFGSENIEHCTPALFSRRALESSHLLEDSKAVIRVGRWRPVGEDARPAVHSPPGNGQYIHVPASIRRMQLPPMSAMNSGAGPRLRFPRETATRSLRTVVTPPGGAAGTFHSKNSLTFVGNGTT